MTDPGFPAVGVDLVGGRRLPRQLRIENFVCRNERIRMRRARPLDPPMRFMMKA